MKNIINQNKVQQKISTFALTMIAISGIISVRTVSEIAVYGTSCILTIIIVSLIFILPVTITTIELSTQFPKGGGYYTWVKEIFSEKIGFYEAYIELAINVILMTLVLSFICGNFAYLINTDLPNNKLFMFLSGTLTFILITYINCKGLKLSSIISSICAILGVFLPMIIIITFGIHYFINNYNNLSWNLGEMIPNWKTIDYWTSLSSVVLGCSGAEIIAVHVRNVQNVKKSYSIALISLAIASIILYTLAPLSVAMVVPKEKIQFSAGVAQVLQIFFTNIGLGFMSPIIVSLTCLGALGALNSWVISAVKPLLIASEDGMCHKIFSKLNNNEAPIVLLILQVLAVIMFLFFMIFIPTANDFFWIITVLCSQNAVLVYLIVFPIYFIYVIKNNKNTLKMKILKITLTILGTCICFFTFIIGFTPNPTISLSNNKFLYFIYICIGLIISWLPAIPLYMSGKNKKGDN